MRMGMGIISLLFVAMLTLCVPNVAAVPPVSKFTTTPSGEHIMYAMTQAADQSHNHSSCTSKDQSNVRYHRTPHVGN